MKNLLTYVFKGNYLERSTDRDFIKDIILHFTPDEVTGLGVKINNNPLALEVFIFITIDTNHLHRETFSKWLKDNHPNKFVEHNIFLSALPSGGNIITFTDEFSLIAFDHGFIDAYLISKDDGSLKDGNQYEFEEKHPQYKKTNHQIPVVFISHSSLDKNDIVVPLCDYLCTNEIPIWLDRNEIKMDELSGESELDDTILEKLKNGIDLCKTAIFIVTDNFFMSKWTLIELDLSQKMKKKIILMSNDKENLSKIKDYDKYVVLDLGDYENLVNYL